MFDPNTNGVHLSRDVSWMRRKIYPSLLAAGESEVITPTTETPAPTVATSETDPEAKDEETSETDPEAEDEDEDHVEDDVEDNGATDGVDDAIGAKHEYIADDSLRTYRQIAIVFARRLRDISCVCRLQYHIDPV
jgi:hypothetical protein